MSWVHILYNLNGGEPTCAYQIHESDGITEVAMFALHIYALVDFVLTHKRLRAQLHYLGHIEHVFHINLHIADGIVSLTRVLI